MCEWVLFFFEVHSCRTMLLLLLLAARIKIFDFVGHNGQKRTMKGAEIILE